MLGTLPRRPGGPPHLGCCGSNYLSQAHTQQQQFPNSDVWQRIVTLFGNHVVSGRAVIRSYELCLLVSIVITTRNSKACLSECQFE